MASPSQSTTKASVFVVNLGQGEIYQNFWDELYQDLITPLTAKYRVQRVRRRDHALRWLREPANKPVAILVPDSGVLLQGNRDVPNLIYDHAMRGATVLFHASFSSFAVPDEMATLWEKWGTKWRAGDYVRTITQLNR